MLKLTNNILFAVSPATCEAFVMGTKGGLDPEVMVNAINTGSGRSGGTLTLVYLAVLDRFETKWLSRPKNLAALADLPTPCGSTMCTKRRKAK